MSVWYYQLLGEEFGPVSESTLATLLREGTLSPSDLVRSEDSQQWITAQAVSAELADRVTDLSELSFEFEDSMPDKASRLKAAGPESPGLTDPGSETTTPAEDAMHGLYFYQIRGQSHGPVKRETMIRMAEQGRLSDTDLVRTDTEFLWQAAAEYHEFSAAFLLRKSESQGKQRVISPGSARDSQATPPPIEKPPAIPETAERSLEKNVARDDKRRDQGPTGSAKPRANHKKPRQRATTASAELDDDVFQEVFSEEPTSPAQSAGQTRSADANRDSNTPLKATPVPNAMPTEPSVSQSYIPLPHVAADRMGLPSSNGQRGPLMPTRPPTSRKAASRSRTFEFDFEFSTPMKVLSGMLLLAAVWFGYGPLKRMLTTSESHYISRAEEAIKTFESLETTMDRVKYGESVQKVTRELEAYLVILKEAGSTGKSSMACAGALNRIVEFGRLDPANEKLRSKLLTEAKQLISAWKGN